jgi:aminomethyltransferase
LYIISRRRSDVELEFLNDRGLIAVQGPEAAQLVEAISKVNMTAMPFMASTMGSVAGVEDCRITRCG